MPLSKRKLLLLAPFFAAICLLVASCGSDAPTPECLAAEDGTFVPASCEAPAGATLEPTPTPPPTNGGGGPGPGFSAFASAGCAGCHTIDGTPARGLTGPNLTMIASRGEAYIRESIVLPNAQMAPACPSGPCVPSVMPQDFGDRLSEETIDEIVEFLLGL